MADSVDVIKSEYPLTSYQYRVTVSEMSPMAFSEVSGLSIEYESITYKDGLSFKEGPKLMPGQLQMPSITLKKGVVAQGSELFEWINATKLNASLKKTVLIELLDAEANALIVWKVENAFPTKLEAPSFNADSSEVAVETLSLMANQILIEYQ
jgi:phage tail-like protein